MKKEITSEPETKSYSLKPAETNLLIYIQQHSQNIFSGVLSTIAMDRLAYAVTDKTQFNLNDTLTELRITELEDKPKAEPVVKAE